MNLRPFALALLAASFLSACSSAERRAEKAVGATKHVEQKLAANEAAQKLRLQRELYAVGVALEQQSLPLASEFHGRAQSVAGLPTAAVMSDVRQIVTGLLSENAALRQRATARDAEAARALARLQDENARLQARLAENRRLERAAAEVAVEELGTLKGQVNSWFGLGAVSYGLKRLFVAMIVAVGCILILVLALAVIPATAPIGLPIMKMVVDAVLALFEFSGRILASIFRRFRGTTLPCVLVLVLFVSAAQAQTEPAPGTELQGGALLQLVYGLTALFNLIMVAGGIILWLVNRGKEGERTLTNDPLGVRLEEDFVSKEDFNDLKLRVDENDASRRAEILALGERMQNIETELLKAGEERAERIFQRINMVARDTQDQINAMPDRIIKILRNTGVIKVN